MTPISLRIKNWGPFKEAAEFVFPSGPGLHFLWGRNEVNPRLGANACGKTRLWEALVWVIYGKTSAGLKAGDVANWDHGKNASVEFKYFVDGDPALECCVVRTWSPNTWGWSSWDGVVVDLAKDETNPLIADLRLSFNSFLATVLMAQGEDMFPDLKPDKKAALFSEVMNLDRWLTYADNASKRASEFDRQCRTLEKDLARLEGQLDQFDDQAIIDLSADWVKTRTDREAKLEDTYGKLLDDEARATAELSEAKLAEDRNQGLVAEWLENGKKAAAEATAAEAAERKVKNDLIAAEHEMKACAGHLEFLDAHRHCPTCQQDLTGPQHDEQLKKAKKTLKFCEEHVDELRAREAKHRKATDKASATLEATNNRFADFHRALRLAETETKAARSVLATVSRDLDRLEDEAEKLANEKNPYAEMLDQSAQRQQALAKDIRKTRRLLDDADAQYRLASYWVRGFKEIRLELIGEALTQLEIEVNSEVSNLGLVGWSLHFDVDRETKGGSVQRGFTVTVLSPHNSKPVPWEAWSGGEAQRLRVAAQCGLANLIRGNTGATIDLEVWDEPTAGMSPEGISDLLKALADRAAREQRQVWIVDHHSLSFGGFTGRAMVVKTKAGSVFEQEDPYNPGQEPTRATQLRPPDAARRQVHDDVRNRTQTRRALLTERTAR